MKALSGAACYAMTPHLVREFEQRGKDHIGYAAALLELSRRAEHLSPIFGEVGEETIRRLTGGRGELRSHLERKGLNAAQISDLLDGLAGQAALTVERRWGLVEPLELLGRALEGGLNIAPRAIRDDVTEAARPHSRQRRFEVSFERRSSGSPGPEGTDPCDVAMRPDAEAEYRELLTEIEKNPELLGFVLEAASADTQIETAKKLGVTDRTVRNLRQKLLKTLHGL
jgi:hypothetical protein